MSSSIFDDATDISVGSEVEEVIGSVETDEENLSRGNLLEFLSRIGEIMPDIGDENEEDKSNKDMDADSYHNKAVERARHKRNREAAEICMEGLQKFPLSVDLLADVIKYSSDAGDKKNADKHYAILKEKVPFHRWNWRAFTFVFDYLLADDSFFNECECRLIVENYKKYLEYEEKSLMAESQLEAALGNMENSMNVLKNAISTHSNASQCALRLADMQMDRGLYEDVLVTTNYGIAASAEVQPSINIPYLYYLRTLAKDHILHRKECNGETITKEELDELRNEYELLISEFPELLCHMHTIKMREKMLKFVKTE